MRADLSYFAINCQVKKGYTTDTPITHIETKHKVNISALSLSINRDAKAKRLNNV